MSDGGCPVLNFHLSVKEITEAVWTEVDAGIVPSDPNLRAYDIDMSDPSVGAFYLVRMTAVNSVGSTNSDSS